MQMLSAITRSCCCCLPAIAAAATCQEDTGGIYWQNKWHGGWHAGYASRYFSPSPLPLWPLLMSAMLDIRELFRCCHFAIILPSYAPYAATPPCLCCCCQMLPRCPAMPLRARHCYADGELMRNILSALMLMLISLMRGAAAADYAPIFAMLRATLRCFLFTF